MRSKILLICLGLLTLATLALGGCGGGTQGGPLVPTGTGPTPTETFTAPTARWLTSAMANGTLTHSARFINEYTLEVVNTEWRYSAAAGVYVTAPTRTLYVRTAAGSWNPYSPETLTTVIPNADSVMRTHPTVTQNGYSLGGMANSSGHQTATIAYDGKLLTIPPILQKGGNYCNSEWTIAATPKLTRVCVIASFSPTPTSLEIGGRSEVNGNLVPGATPDPLPPYQTFIVVLEQ